MSFTSVKYIDVIFEGVEKFCILNKMKSDYNKECAEKLALFLFIRVSEVCQI